MSQIETRAGPCQDSDPRIEIHVADSAIVGWPSTTPARAGVATASTTSVDADGLQLVAPCIRNRRFAAIGQHDRSAIGGMERKQLKSRRNFRRLRKQSRHVFGADLLDVGD